MVPAVKCTGLQRSKGGDPAPNKVDVLSGNVLKSLREILRTSSLYHSPPPTDGKPTHSPEEVNMAAAAGEEYVFCSISLRYPEADFAL